MKAHEKLLLSSIKDMWQRCGDAGEYDVEARWYRSGNVTLAWRRNAQSAWAEVYTGTLAECVAYLQGRIDGEGL